MLRLSLADRVIETDRKAFVMGIVNATKDSFFSLSRGGIDLAKKLIDEGADILDIGAESTRPGSIYVDEEEQIRKLVPLISKIRSFSQIPISVDTRKVSVMKACYESGADIFNDISALEDDEESVCFAASHNIPVILMHKRGIPSEMQKNTSYGNVFDEVDSYLRKRVQFAIDGGINAEKIIVDPGIGFGKDLFGNVDLIRNVGRLCDGKYKVLMALSRKTCIGQMISSDTRIFRKKTNEIEPPLKRLYGTLAADMISVINGATIIRVHDVRPAVDTLSVMSYIM